MPGIQWTYRYSIPGAPQERAFNTKMLEYQNRFVAVQHKMLEVHKALEVTGTLYFDKTFIIIIIHTDYRTVPN